MNGRLNKVVMTGKIMRMKTGLYEKTWYPEWDDRQRGAANRILTNVLEVLDEYWAVSYTHLTLPTKWIV